MHLLAYNINKKYFAVKAFVGNFIETDFNERVFSSNGPALWQASPS
jgi:hypothetical protein